MSQELVKQKKESEEIVLLVNNNANETITKLNFEKETSVWAACGAVLNGQHWLIGGDPDRRQVSH